MTLSRLIVAVGVALILLVVGLILGAWWYLFSKNEFESADLVPANTVFFASIPNGIKIAEGYEGSHAKTLIDNPNSKPLFDALSDLAGKKTVDLIQGFLPNLSGQSFIAVTHFDYDHPEKIGLIAAMRPKAGLGDFDSFLEKLKATWPDMVKQGRTGTDSVEGVEYQWIQGPGAQDKICVAKFKGWIVTTWGEGSLRDWIQRVRKEPTTSSLTNDVNYAKTIVRVGEDPMAVVYVNLQQVLTIAETQMEKVNPTVAKYITEKSSTIGGAAVGTRFENGDIVDRFTVVIPRSVQLECGLPEHPCPFDTLQFTGPNTRLYWASGINWRQYYAHLKDRRGLSAYNQTSPNPAANELMAFVKNWVHEADIDTNRNIVEALGSEMSVQVDWNESDTYPEVGMFVKVDKPNDFKPTITAIVESVRKAYATSAVIQELKSNGHTFAALQFVKESPFTPTITEDGDYFGVFLTENQAVRSFGRAPGSGLEHRTDFTTQIGDKRNGATQISFLDAPYLLDRAYRTAMPYVSMAGMLDKNLASMIRGKDLPQDLTWLAPMGTWSGVITPDEESIQAYSVSGIGNQGVLVLGLMGATTSTLQTLGYLPKYTGEPLASALTPPPSVPEAPSTSIILITSDSKILVDETLVSTNDIGDLLKTKRLANPRLKLIVRVDRNALPDILSAVMDAGASAGFGVLPYSYNPVVAPPPTNTDAAVPSALTNAPAVGGTQSTPNSAPADTNATPGPVAPNAATPPVPATNSTSNATETPGPLPPH